jgi:uncharacterized protein with PIN domain
MADASGLCSRPIPKFLLDAHLGRLARYLRMLGFDAAFDPALDDPELMRRAAREGRRLLSRDRALVAAAGPELAYSVRAVPPVEQLGEVVDAFALRSCAQPLTRCLACNAPLRRIAKALVEERVPRGVAEQHDEFWACSGCGKVYWRGSHFDRMKSFAARFVESGRSQSP